MATLLPFNKLDGLYENSVSLNIKKTHQTTIGLVLSKAGAAHKSLNDHFQNKHIEQRQSQTRRLFVIARSFHKTVVAKFNSLRFCAPL
jgi:hypothetical protein